MQPRSAHRSCILVLLSAMISLGNIASGCFASSAIALKTRSPKNSLVSVKTNTISSADPHTTNPFKVTTEQEHVDNGANQFGANLKAYFEGLDGQNDLLNGYNDFNRLSQLQSQDPELFARQDRIWHLRLAQQQPEPKAGPVNIEAQDIATTYMTYADFANANKALETFMQTMDGRDYADDMCNPYTEEFWYLLDKCDPSEIAIKIADKASAMSYLPERELAIAERRTNFAARLKEIRRVRLNHLGKPVMMAALDQEGLWYDQLRQLNKAIIKHDRPDTQRLIDLVLLEYNKSLARPNTGNFNPNAILGTITNQKYKLSWFGALIQFSRQLSDSGDIASSEKILIAIQAATSRYHLAADGLPIVLAERIINQYRLQAGSVFQDSSKLKALYQSMHLSQFPAYQNLRWLGHLYDNAGYHQRAEIFLKAALSMPYKKQPDTESVLLRLDAAANAAHLNNFANASKLANEAISNASSPQIKGGTPEWILYNKAYRCKVSDLADIYMQQKRFDEAKLLLLAAQSRSQRGATKYAPAKSADSSEPDGINGILDARLGQLYALTKQPALAVPCLKQATAPFDSYVSFVPTSHYLLLADCAKSIGKYADAAKAYSHLARSTQSEPWRIGYINSDAQERYLTLALQCANKAPDLDAKMRVDIIKELAAALKRHSPDDRLELELAAYKTVPDSNPTKQEIAASLAALASERAFKSPAYVKPSMDLRIEMLEQVAILNEKSYPQYCAHAWRDLAAAEISDNRWQSAPKHFMQAIAKCTKESAHTNPDKPFIAVWDLRKGELPFGSEQSNEYKIGKEVLIKATSRYEELCTKQSPQTSLQAAQLVMFDIQHRQYQEAYRELDEMLKPNISSLNDTETNTANGVDALISYVSYLDPAHILVTQNILMRIIEAQKRDHPSNAFCISQTYYALADACAKARLYKESVEFYQNARAVIALYDVTMDDYDKIKANAEVMKKSGDVEGAATLLKTYLRQQKNAEIAAKTESKDQVTLNTSHRIINGDITQALTEYRERLKTDPYSQRSEALLDALLLYHLHDKDATLLKELLQARWEIARRVYYVVDHARTTQLSKLAEPYSKLIEMLDRPHKPEELQKVWQTVESNEVNYKHSQVAI